MEFALWAYPWDMVDEGVASTANRFADMGIGEVNLATNYHHVQAFSPHNPQRRTVFAQASSYFHPGDTYGRLEPIPYGAMADDDWLAQIDDEVADSDIDLNSWTIGSHNSRLGLRNPDVTLRSPHGDSLAFGLCPSHPDVQEYLVALLEDLDGRADFKRIELESFDYFHGSGFGWHHDKFHTNLGALGEFLFGLCFCDHCQANAADAGVDVETAREESIAAIDALAEGILPADIDIAGWLAAHPSVADYANARMETLTDLFEEFRQVVDADLGYYVGLLDVANTWMHGVDLSSVVSHLDYITVTAYEESARAVLDDIRTARALAPDAEIHAGLLPGYPAVDDRATVEAMVDALAAEGIPRVSFYNYGLLPERNLEWIADAIQPYANS